MSDQLEEFEHVFRYKRHKVWLTCSIEVIQGDRYLILEEISATKQEIADGVSDCLIEAEACDAASARNAKYM